MADDDTDDTAAVNHSAMPDPFVLAIGLCQIAANAKSIEPALKRLRKLGRDIAKAEQKLAAVTAQAEQTNAELAARAAAIDERDRALDAREAAFEASVHEAHAALRASHDNLGGVDRRLRYRIASSADMLHGFNEQLQDLPSWQQIKQMVPGLPDDLPAAPAAEIISQENVREDWSGNVFVPGSTVTRTINKVAS
jgi:septal ring factor EnvC (AmiA/AmiB activator)